MNSYLEGFLLGRGCFRKEKRFLEGNGYIRSSLVTAEARLRSELPTSRGPLFCNTIQFSAHHKTNS